MTNEFAWLEPIRKRARKLEEETKRIRAETENLLKKRNVKMVNLDKFFEPENKFVVPVSFHLSAADEVRLRKFINLHYLGDEDANELIDGQYRAKYPEKETKEFKDVSWRISGGYTVNLVIEFDTNGNPTFGVMSND